MRRFSEREPSEGRQRSRRTSVKVRESLQKTKGAFAPRCFCLMWSSVPAAAASAALRLRTGLVHGQRAAAVFLARERRDRVTRLVVIAELDEPEALRATRIAIGDDRDGADRPIGREERAKVVLRGVVGKVTDVEFHRNRILETGVTIPTRPRRSVGPTSRCDSSVFCDR